MHVFTIVPAGDRYLWILLPISALLFGVIALLTVSFRGGQTARFEVSGEGLRLRGDLYGRLIPLASLRVADARRVDLAAEKALQPSWRRMGTALPGYQAGWFRLKNGEKALLYLTDRSRAVYVPTTKGYSLILSPVDPDGFLAKLRSP
jgi:hypothetical protein